MSFSPLPLNREINLIDEGSSGCRLYRVSELCRWPSFIQLANIEPKLIHQVELDGKFDPKARAEALNLFGFAARAASPGALNIGIGTEVFRVALPEQSEQFEIDAKVLFKESSPFGDEIDFQRIEGGREAALAAKGVLFSFPKARGLVVHIGGGSVDFAYIGENGTIEHVHSLHIGVDKLKKRFIDEAPKNRKKSDEAAAYQAASTFILSEIETIPWFKDLPKEEIDLYIEGGNCRPVGRAFIKTTDYPIDVIHGLSLNREEYTYILDKLSPARIDTWRSTTRQITVRKDRLPFSSLILKALTDQIQFKNMIVSETGVREGIFYEGMPEEMRVQSPLISACPALLVACPDDKGLNERAARLERWVRKFLPPDAIRPDLLKAICLLSDSGAGAAKHNTAKAAYHAILHHQFGDLTHEERAIMALATAVRYSEKTKPDETREALHLLKKSPEKVELATLIGQTMGLAYQFGYVSQQLDAIEVEATDDGLESHIPLHTPYIDTKEVKGFLIEMMSTLRKKITIVSTPSSPPSSPLHSTPDGPV